jgi:hypothetical protein
MRAATMEKLILTVAPSSADTHAVSVHTFQPGKEADLTECLKRLRGALFLTGSVVESAEMIEDDCGSEWAGSDLLQRLVGPLH